MEQLEVKQIYSYDKEFGRLDYVERLEPEMQQGEKRSVVQLDQSNVTSQPKQDE
jgi:hypothetical protein